MSRALGDRFSVFLSFSFHFRLFRVLLAAEEGGDQPSFLTWENIVLTNSRVLCFRSVLLVLFRFRPPMMWDDGGIISRWWGLQRIVWDHLFSWYWVVLGLISLSAFFLLFRRRFPFFTLFRFLCKLACEWQPLHPSPLVIFAGELLSFYTLSFVFSAFQLVFLSFFLRFFFYKSFVCSIFFFHFLLSLIAISCRIFFVLPRRFAACWVFISCNSNTYFPPLHISFHVHVGW